MSAPDAILAVVVGTGVALLVVMAVGRRSILRDPPPPAPAELPPVSILKPLKGVDADLAENLRTTFRQDYPAFEVILGAEDDGDPALPVARAIAREFPGVRSLVIADDRAVGHNPKVNNLANLFRRARHDVVLVSDSNIAAPPGYLKDLVAHRARSGAGLVWSLFRATGGRGLGAALEALQLNVFVMGGVSALSRLLRLPCCVGKSMLLGRADLAELGGFEFLSKFLAEDQICAEELAARGRPVAVSGHLIDNVLGRRTVRDFASRHVRWSRLRRWVNLPGYLGELLLNPVFLAFAGALALRTPAAWATAGAALVAASALDAVGERAVGVRRPLWIYPVLEAALSLARGLLFPIPFFGSTLRWRSNVLTIGPRTRIDVKRGPEDVFDTRGHRVAA